jgi:hypothetical protein
MITPRAPPPRARLPSADRVGVLVRPRYSPAERASAAVWLPRLLADLAAALGSSPAGPDDVDRSPAGTIPPGLAPTQKPPLKR